MAGSKYHNRRIISNGEKFDSKKEERRYKELRALEKSGVIRDLKRQVKFVLIPSHRENGRVTERECSYYADFTYIQDKAFIVEDVKGFRTPEYKIKRKLMLHIHGIKIKEV